MRARSSLLSFLLAGSALAQEPADQDPAHIAALVQRLAKLAEDAPATEALAPHLAELLVHPDPRVRASVLVLVLGQPRSFGESREALLQAMAAPRLDDCAALAYAAAEPHFLLPVEQALRLLDSNSSAEVDRGVRSLARDVPALLPRLQDLLVRSGTTPRGAVTVMRKVHEQAPDAAVAAIAAAMPQLGNRTGEFVQLMREWGAQDPPYVEALFGLLRDRQDMDVVRELARIASADAAVRARLGDLCGTVDVKLAAQALNVLAELGTGAADQWPKVQPCLRAGLLLQPALMVARNLAVERPDAIAAVIASLPSADAYELAVLASELPRCGATATAAIPVLAARLPQADAQASVRVSQALLLLGGDDALLQVLPALLDHADGAVRARACTLAGAIGAGGEAVRERLLRNRGAGDPAAASAAALALRLLDDATTVPAVELADLVRDRDEWRALATVMTMRRRSPQTSEAEAAGLMRFLVPSGFGIEGWAERQVMRDLDSGRLGPADLARMMAGIHFGWNLLPQLLARPDARSLFAALLREPRLLLAVHQCCQRPGPTQRQLVTELQPALRAAAEATRDPIIRSTLQSVGLVAGGPAPPAALSLPRPAEWLEQLAGNDGEQRERAARRLAGYFTRDLIEPLRKLRREGDAQQRRYAAAISDAGWTLEQQCAYARAPEVFVVTSALRAMLQSPVPTAAPRLPARAVDAVFAALRPEVLVCLGEEGQAGPVLAAVAMLGERGLRSLRAAMQVPSLRTQVLPYLYALGPAAREFLPDVLRMLRSPSREAAGRVLAAMALAPGDPEYQTALTEVAALWQESVPYERAGLLAAVAALGPGAGFAREGVRELLDSMHASRLLLAPELLKLLPREPLHGWTQLALRSDQAVQVQIALLVLAASDRFQAAPADLEAVWKQAASSPALVGAVRRWAAEAKDAEADRMVALVLDAFAADKPLPAGGEVLALHAPRVAAALAAHLRSRGWSRPLAAALAQYCPFLLLDQLDGADPQQQGLIANVLTGLPPGTDGLAARVDRSLRASGSGTQHALAHTLVAQGPPALPLLRVHLVDAADPVRKVLLQALQGAGSTASYAVPALREALGDDGDEDMLEVASRLGGPGLRFAIQNAASPEQATARLARAATVGDPATRTAALRLLHEMDPERAVVAARANAGHPVPEVRRWAGLVLLAGHGDEVDAATLQPLFFDDEPLIRRRALETLARAARWPEPLGTAATDLLTDGDVGVRRAAAAAFATHAEEAVRSRVALIEAHGAETDPATIRDLDRALASR